ncbi:GNAT family N-acetyltransferase [Candidatus Uhrbacteria bacterium]|nr:GNAT family N-acetyltransferase [Candidatus Uhrbacteria bacterium]
MFEFLKPSTTAAPKEQRKSKDERQFTIDDVEEILPPDEHYEFGHTARKVYHGHIDGWDDQRDFEQSAEWAKEEHAYDYSIISPDEVVKRKFVIRDKEENIIAGAQVDLHDRNGVKMAYLGSKFVLPEYREQNIANLLVQKRLDVAREAGCEVATAIVAANNGPALRTIMKDGFIIEDLPQNALADRRRVSLAYRMLRNLNTPKLQAPASEELLHASIARKEQEITGDQPLLIDHSETMLILTALTKGYIGRWVVLPKELGTISQPMVYLVKKEEYLKESN